MASADKATIAVYKAGGCVEHVVQLSKDTVASSNRNYSSGWYFASIARNRVLHLLDSIAIVADNSPGSTNIITGTQTTHNTSPSLSFHVSLHFETQQRTKDFLQSLSRAGLIIAD
jgi:hypothetical protein